MANLALDKLMQYLAKKDCSEWELRKKLNEKSFDTDDIDEAIQYAKDKGWILPPQELAEKIEKVLNRKAKSYAYIRQYLSQHQLPILSRKDDLEFEKALELVNKKFRIEGPISFEQKKKVYQYLRNRYYDEASIRMVINEII